MKKIFLLSLTFFLVCCLGLAYANTQPVASSASEAQNAKKVHAGPAVQFSKDSGENMQKVTEQVLPYVKVEQPGIQSQDNSSIHANPNMPAKPEQGVVPPADPNMILQGGDNIALATPIAVLPYADAGMTTGYANDYDAICPYSGGTAPDVVYSYTPAANMAITADVCASLYDTKIYIFENDEFTTVACSDDNCGDDGWKSSVSNVPIFLGNTYYIVVDGYGTSAGDYSLTVTEGIFTEPPPNDNCGDIAPLALVPGTPLVYTGDNSGATADCSLAGYAEVWMSFTTTQTLNISINSCTTPVAQSWVGTWLMTDCPCTIYIPGNVWNWTDCGDGNWTIYYNNLPAGTYYYPFISQANYNPTGPYTVTVNGAEPPPAPPNDNCVDVVPQPLVVGTTLTFTGDNSGATNDCSILGTYGEAWHAFTISEELNVTVDFCGTTPAFGNYYWVLVPDCPCSAYILRSWYDWTTCGDNNLYSGYDRLPAGTYYIPVLSDIGSMGPYTINVNGTVPPPAPPNDNCFDVTPLPLNDGGTVTFNGDNTGCSIDCPGLGTPEVWHAVTTTECMNITVDYCGTPGPWGNVYIVMADACPCGAFTFANNWDAITCTDGNYTVRWVGVPAGTWYIPIMYDPGFMSIGPYTINVAGTACPPPPANDDCANAELVGEVTDLAWSTTTATFDGAGACMSSNNLWYLYTASASAPVTVSLCGSSFDTKLAVYEGASCPSTGIPPTPSPLQGGEDIASAVPIGPLPAAWTGTTVSYLNDYAPTCVFSSAPDVVYSLVPASNQSINVEYCGSTYDTGLSILDDTMAEIACNDDYCGLQSAVYGVPVEAGRTYYIIVDGYSSNAGDYVITVTGASYVMLECNDDFCGLQSEIVFNATAATQYLIEVGGYSSSFGDGILNISVPVGHDVAVSGLSSPRQGGLLDGSTPVDVIASIANLGLSAETFSVMASDDHGFSSVYGGLTLNPGETGTITFPNQYTPTTTCTDYNFTIQTQLAGDMDPTNDTYSATLRVARTADQTFQYDTDVVANAWYFFAEGNLTAFQYTADADKQIAYLGAHTYVDELGAPWPDATADPFRLSLFLDLDLDGFPDLDPAGEVTVLPTGVSPSVSYGVLDCGIEVTAGQNFWVAFGNIDDAPAHGSEGIAQDDLTDYMTMKWTRLAGVWAQGEYYAGDEMLRAYAVTGAPVGCVYVRGDINGNGVGNGIDVTYGVSYFKGGNVPPIRCDNCPQPAPFYAAGDVNGNCTFNGIDITFFVGYLKGQQPALRNCDTCPPATFLTPVPETPTIVPTKANVRQTQE